MNALDFRQDEAVDIALLYFDGCPNWVEADRRLREALVALHLSEIVVDYRNIDSPEAAAAAKFRGSPTILIDQRDPFDPGGDEFGLSCRVYATPTGLEGSPTVEQLIAALT